MTLSPEKMAEQLSAPLERGNVKKNPKGFDYIEGWHAIAEANRIFGPFGWDRVTLSMDMLAAPEKVENNWRVAYRARCRVTVYIEGREVVRDGTGYGSGIGRDIRDIHESATKEAETDAMKRALMTFGNPFGLALYDKLQLNVVDAPAEEERSPAEIYAAQVLSILATTPADELMPMWKGVVVELKKFNLAFADNPTFVSLKEAFAARQRETMKEAA